MMPNPDAHYEKTTPILSVERDDGRLLMVNHGCHPTGWVPHPSPIFLVRCGPTTDDARTQVVMFIGAAGGIKQGAQV